MQLQLLQELVFSWRAISVFGEDTDEYRWHSERLGYLKKHFKIEEGVPNTQK